MLVGHKTFLVSVKNIVKEKLVDRSIYWATYHGSEVDPCRGCKKKPGVVDPRNEPAVYGLIYTTHDDLRS